VPTPDIAPLAGHKSPRYETLSLASRKGDIT
jgi:hypothetical protein